jgi:hypothetical protein
LDSTSLTHAARFVRSPAVNAGRVFSVHVVPMVVVLSVMSDIFYHPQASNQEVAPELRALAKDTAIDVPVIDSLVIASPVIEVGITQSPAIA